MPIDFASLGLPIVAALPALAQSLADCPNAVLLAPPGAGKTTLVAPFLLDQPWLAGGKILLMLPRRLAARAAAERIASLLGESPGAQIGYRTRLESVAGSRIECITEGLFVNRLLGDPALEGVGALLFDEVHERNLEGDLGLALALDAQQLRPELRILAMSATLDGARFARLMDDAPLIESKGQGFPVSIRHLGRSDARIEDRVAAAIRAGLAEQEGSLLAFLPGVAEIERVAQQLRLPPDVALHKLYGAADPAAQRAALRPGGRKVVLATAIAETSLTIDGVRVVVDSGLSRKPAFDPAAGLSRLVTIRVSQAAATQRAGRAGRQAPGLVLRLWEESETRGLLPYDPPEILDADLSSLLLRLASWGVQDPGALRWLDPPPAGAVAAARAGLERLGALDNDGRLTAHGRQIAALPLAPPIAHMLLEGAASGQADLTAAIAVLLEERGVGGSSSDFEDRLRRLSADKGAVRGHSLAARWAKLATRLQKADGRPALVPALLLAAAFPDRLARRRRVPGASDTDAEYLLANGRGAKLPATDPLAKAEWLVVADAGGAGASARIRLAAAVEPEALFAWLPGRTTVDERLDVDPASGRLGVIRIERLGAIEIARRRMPAAPEVIAAALLAEVCEKGLSILPWPASEQASLARIRFAAAQGGRGHAWSDAELLERLDLWLAPRLAGLSRLADVQLEGALLSLLDWPERQALDRLAPARFETPANTSHMIDYLAEGGPEVEVRPQMLFGLSKQPMLADGGVPLTMVLVSPAGRPIARTRDLPSFWQYGWKDVRRELKGRYPKHPWPEDPQGAAPTTRTKAASLKSGG